MGFPVSRIRGRRAGKSRGNRELKAIRPQLTSMVDATVLLLIYLLQSFSAEGEIVTVSKDMQLPISSAQKKPDLRVVITVNNQHILAEDAAVASVDQVLSDEALVIAPLYEWLGKRREMTEKISQYSTKTKFTGDIMILGDKRIRFRLLKKIMYTCGQQGFNNFSLAVQRKD